MSLQSMFQSGEPDLIPGKLRGYRTWNLNALGESAATRPLNSTGMAYNWPEADQTARAECAPNLCDCFLCTTSYSFRCDGPSPNVDCTCGFYGWYAPDDVRIVHGAVQGVIEATGRVIMGTHGFRAECVRVVAVTSCDAQFTDHLRGAGLLTFDTYDQLVAAYPPDDLSGVITHVCDDDCITVAKASLLSAAIAAGLSAAALAVALRTVALRKHLMEAGDEQADQ